MPSSKKRFYELDALRGLAAVTVLFRHFSDVFDHSHQGVLRQLAHGHFETWYVVPLLRLSPFGFLAQGHAAVVLFFVLSGFVLTGPFLAGRGSVPLHRFVAKRVIRLYPPYFCALVLSVLADYLFSHHGVAGIGTVVNNSWSRPINAHDVLVNMQLFFAGDLQQFNSAFWSLSYEMNMALLFPLVAWISLAGPLSLAVAFNGLLIAVGALFTPGPEPGEFFFNLCVAGMFGVGAVLAKHHENLVRLYQRLGVKSRIVLGVAALEALGYGLMIGLATTGRAWAGELLLVPAAGIVIVAALADSHWQKFLNRPSCQFLGKISYSLYLIHMAVLLPLVYLTWETALGHLSYYWVLLFVAFAGISVGLAWLFWGAIETRATNWSRSFGWQKAPRARAVVAGAGGGLTETFPG